MATAAADHSKETASSTQSGPVIVDLGRKRRKRVKQLRDGTGKLMDQVKGVIEELRTSGTVGANAQPVVVIVRERRKKATGMLGFSR